MENTAKDQNKRKKQRAHCSQNIHHKYIEKRKKERNRPFYIRNTVR
jgi:hypothetical protein